MEFGTIFEEMEEGRQRITEYNKLYSVSLIICSSLSIRRRGGKRDE
jgi:hypothetical protein